MKQSHIVTSHKQSSRKGGGIVTSYVPGNSIWSSIIHDVNVAVLMSGIVKHISMATKHIVVLSHHMGPATLHRVVM